MNKLCVIYNSAPHYRRGIFKMMEEEYNIDWYFDKELGDIKSLPQSFFKNVTYIPNLKVYGPIYWQKGVSHLISNKEYKTFLMLGELYAMSTWFALIKKKIFYPKKKIYLWSHGFYGKESRIKRGLKKIFFCLSNGVFLYGEHSKKLMIHEGLNKNKLFVIHNSLDYNTELKIRNQLGQDQIYSNHFHNNKPTLLFIGRLTRVKRLDLLLEAVSILNKDGENFNLVLVGNGEMKDELQTKARDLKIEDSTWFYGACYDELQNARLIYNADICISPGNVGLTAIHSLMFGTPVITHGNFAWQMPEFEAIRKGVTGDFFNQGSSKDLADVISTWIDNHKGNRELIRRECFKEIDKNWTPQFQMEVLRKNLEND